MDKRERAAHRLEAAAELLQGSNPRYVRELQQLAADLTHPGAPPVMDDVAALLLGGE